MKKVIAMILATIMVLSASVGCVKLKEDILTVGEVGVSYNAAAIYLLSVKMTAEQSGGLQYVGGEANEDASNIDYAPLKEEAYDYMERIAISANEALKAGNDLTQEEKDSLKEEANSVFEQYKQTNEALVTDNDITAEAFEEILLTSALAEKYAKSIEETVEVPQEELDASLEMFVQMDPKYAYLVENGVDDPLVRASHILISTSDAATGAPMDEEAKKAAKAKADEALARAKAGEDFAALAAEYSEDPGSAQNGGEYTFGRNEMVPEFDTMAFETLKEGEISEVFETQFGYHIMKLSEKNVAVTDEKRAEREAYIAQIEDYAKQQYMYQAVDEAYNKVKESAEVELNQEAWDKLVLK